MKRKMVLIVLLAMLLPIKLVAKEKEILSKDPLVEVVKISENIREYRYDFKTGNLGIKGMYMWGFIKNIPGIKDFVIKPKSVLIEKQESAKWQDIEPRVVEIIKKAYGNIC